ncbi:MAG TPA: hypothetical protein PKY59_25835 [Pyrinomonadaceae bacterium]|nr:hypothetical protein [Pyrinomonadaceae bacterium]
MPEETPNNNTPLKRSTEERGHAKNLETIKKMRSYGESWGASFNPTNRITKLPFIAQRIADAETVADELIELRAPYRVASSTAEDAFDELSPLVTRFERGFRGSGVPDSAVEDLKTYTRKVKGSSRREDSKATLEVPEKAHSVSQLSRTNRIENLDSAIAIADEYGFNPNEPDLKPAAMQTYSDGLKAKTEAVTAAFIPVDNKLDERDEIYYLAEDSLYEIWKAFKDYTISAYGTDSPQWEQIKGLEFDPAPRKKKK